MRRSWTVIALYAALALLVVPVYPHFPSPNEFTRWALVTAMVDHQTIEVSGTSRLLGPRFEDLAVIGNRVYSNKAPGAALTGIPGYLLARPLIGPPSQDNLRPALNAMRLTGATLPLLGLALLFVTIARRNGIADRRTAAVLFVLLFGTPLFAYGLLFFSHALVAAALFGAWALLFASGEPRPWHDVAAGALVGISVSSEYPAVIPAALLGAALLARRDWRRVARFVAGGLPFALFLGWYQNEAFGSPFAVSYSWEKLPQYREVARGGFFGIHLPSPSILFRLLADRSKGLLLFSPVLLVGAAAFRATRDRMDRAARFALAAMPLALLLVYAGWPNWHGGWTLGPRYITAVIPFAVFPLLFVESTILELVLAGWSVAACVVTTLGFPLVPNDVPLPWGPLGLRLLRHGLTMPNLLHLAVPLLAIVVPLLLVGAAMVVATGHRAWILAAGCVVALLCGIAADRWLMTPPQRLACAYVEEVYFEQPGAIARTFPGIRLPPRLLAREAGDLATPPSSWPF